MTAIGGHGCRGIDIAHMASDRGLRWRLWHAAKGGGIIEHRAFALRHQIQALLPARGGSSWLSILLQQCSVRRDCLLHRRSVQLRLPLLVEPAAAKGVDHSIKRCHVHTPASLTTKKNTDSTGCRIIQLLSKLSDLAPCGMEWHGQMVLCEDLLVVHQETALAVEWQGIRMPLIGERRHDRLEQVVIVVAALLGG